jgi:hypothetical protein
MIFALLDKGLSNNCCILLLFLDPGGIINKNDGKLRVVLDNAWKHLG